MTESEAERREAFNGGLRRLPLPKGRGGFDLAFWQERRLAAGLRDALEKTSAGGGYLYGTGGYFYGESA